MTDHLDYNATRNVGDIVRIDGPYFGSTAIVTAFHDQADPTTVDFEITEPAVSHVKVGEPGSCPAGWTDLIKPVYVPRHAA